MEDQRPENPVTSRQKLIALLHVLDDPVVDEGLLQLAQSIYDGYEASVLPQAVRRTFPSSRSIPMVATLCLVLPQLSLLSMLAHLLAL